MPAIQHAIVVNAPRERVVPLVSSPEGLGAWWAEDVRRVPDSTAVELGFFDRATVYRLAPQPPADEIRWRCETGDEWAGTELIFHLQEQDGQTAIRFSHDGWAEVSPYFVSCNTVWGHLLFNLKDVAERGGPPRPLFTTGGMSSGSSGGY